MGVSTSTAHSHRFTLALKTRPKEGESNRSLPNCTAGRREQALQDPLQTGSTSSDKGLDLAAAVQLQCNMAMLGLHLTVTCDLKLSRLETKHCFIINYDPQFVRKSKLRFFERTQLGRSHPAAERRTMCEFGVWLELLMAHPHSAKSWLSVTCDPGQ